MMKPLFTVLLTGVLLISVSCRSQSKQKGEKPMALQLTSTAFQDSSMIPSKYTCDSTNISPQLKWNGAPENTKSYALIADDPDAPGKTWVHWVMFNIPADTTSLEENYSKEAHLPNGAINGMTDFGSNGYGGPCPPSGTHRYFFKIYALDTMLDLDSSATKPDVLKAMKGHILAEGQLMGKYQRQR